MTTPFQCSDVPKSHKASEGTTTLSHQLFEGTTWHSRLLPSAHKFAYPYRYWGVNISALVRGEELPEIGVPIFNQHQALKKQPSGKSSLKQRLLKNLRAKKLPLFSASKKALQQFCPNDYLKDINSLSDSDIKDGSSHIHALHQRLAQAFTIYAGSAPVGDMLGLVVCRNAGLYFSPVNFYLGFDEQQMPTHLLAEVSNTPWDKRHCYGFLLEGENTEFCHDKDFHVSPFNPIDQLYRWQVTVKPAKKEGMKTQSDSGLQVRIAIDISDERGEVLKTGIKISGVPMTDETVRTSLKQNPLMNITSLGRIYWHAFKLYAIKKVPYVNYDEKLADSKQSRTNAKK
ncbi:DUF1365 domain-containing protein [Psychrobacter alimentarius]|uniref:DUF1365 domain-containing protein n=1 Tax=Psychrobacter alimentarius TaxID=261164 RepID=UPI00191827B9|nr:DUF1365 domain-containing protein [Psychrobacter alimentarius]